MRLKINKALLVFTALFALLSLCDIHDAKAQSSDEVEKIDLDDILKDEDLGQDEPDSLDLGTPEEASEEELKAEEQRLNPKPVDLDEEAEAAVESEVEPPPVQEKLPFEDEEPEPSIADDLLRDEEAAPQVQKKAAPGTTPGAAPGATPEEDQFKDIEPIADPDLDQELEQDEPQDELLDEDQEQIAEPEDNQRFQGPPREPPFVDEETENALVDSIEEADDQASRPIFIKLPIEETKEERLERYGSDSYYKNLRKVTAKGKHEHEVKNSEMTSSFSIKYGQVTPPILNKVFSYEDVYGTEGQDLILIDYEHILSRGVGRIGIKGGVGFATASGNGRFDNGDEALEEYDLLVVPANLGLSYKFEYDYDQVLVPYIEGGAAAFGLLETRNDGAEPGTGWSPALYAAGGLALQLDSLDRTSIRAIDRQFGVNHIWLVLEYRQHIGLSQEIDFTGYYISGSVVFDI